MATVRKGKPNIPKGYEKGETSYKVITETYYHKPYKPIASSRVVKATPMEVKVVNPVRVKTGRPTRRR